MELRHHAEVEVVFIGVAQEGIGGKVGIEIFVQVEQTDDAEADRSHLIDQILMPSGIAVGGGNDVAGVFRAVLIVVRGLYVGVGDRSLEVSVGQAEEAREGNAGRNAEFGRTGGVVELELEIAAEAQVELLSPVENVFVIIIYLRRDAEQAA